MGVHISRVKSVDLDSWTDEQMNSILNWGNARANKYWEAKLATGHVPSEAKIENFIRTKYELKRWVMDGPMPDPATLDADGDDDVPLSLVKEKQTLERKESLRKQTQGQPSVVSPPPPAVDLIGGDEPIPRASTAGPVGGTVPPKAQPAPPKATPSNSSLLGLDFLGSEPSPPPRPASTTGFGGAGGQSRPDLKQSILSLYATAPRPQQPSHSHTNSFGSLHSPTVAAAPQMTQQSAPPSAVNKMNDAFSNLSFSNISSPKSASSSAFSGLGGISGMSSNKSPPPQQSSAFGGLGGGSFFDSKPTAAAPAQPAATPAGSGFGGFGGFGSSVAPAKPAAPASSAMDDLFDFSSSAAPAPPPAAPATTNSVFNLSQPKLPPAPTGSAPAATVTANNAMSGSDVWGGNAWADAAPKAATPQPVQSSSNDFGGWGSMSGGSFANTSIVPGASAGFVAQPKVAADEEFGGWTSSTGTTSGNTASKGASGSEDLFSNVWQ